MNANWEMKRSTNQALYRYLPGSWIDFSTTGESNGQYIAKVIRWNCEKLDNINSVRLISTINEFLHSFDEKDEDGKIISNLAGFYQNFTKGNCNIITPKVSEEKCGIVANISPLLFYCPNCTDVYNFGNEKDYLNHMNCKNPKCNNAKLIQVRKIYFCECGYATDVHNPCCPKHGTKYIKWYEKGKNFICTKCKRKIEMETKCPSCDKNLSAENALDKSQFFPYTLNQVDLVDERIDDFISGTDYGSYIVFAYWVGKITLSELYNVINNGIVTNSKKYKKLYDEKYKLYLETFKDSNSASVGAKAAADKQYGTRFVSIADEMKSNVSIDKKNIHRVAGHIMEYDLLSRLDNISDLSSAMHVAKLLNHNACPKQYTQIAEDFGISRAMVCDNIPFILCTYGYTRVNPAINKNVRFNTFEEEKGRHRNIYATKLDSEGVIFEFDRKKIIKWLCKNNFNDPNTILPNYDDEEKLKLWFLNNIKSNIIHPASPISDALSIETYYIYRLIHSLSHLLIKAASEIGGLGKNSLSEYILPEIPAVVIYCQNSQGVNLGTLFNTFEAHFDMWINKAYNDAQKCIFDPICIERYRACTGCLIIDETSCQHANKDLDRSLVIGCIEREPTYKRIYGFWEK